MFFYLCVNYCFYNLFLVLLYFYKPVLFESMWYSLEGFFTFTACSILGLIFFRNALPRLLFEFAKVSATAALYRRILYPVQFIWTILYIRNRFHHQNIIILIDCYCYSCCCKLSVNLKEYETQYVISCSLHLIHLCLLI